ncbi:MAG: 3-hydroxyacyl-[acyl-carrier-protein] dehydratase FabA, partial [Bacteroidota bacterium]
HFYQDPVMPGSLGVEAIYEAIQIFVLQQELAKDFKEVRFQHLPNHQTVWKYRGQILQQDPEMHLEVHVASVERTTEGLIIRADASLWKGTLRIYEVTQLAVLVG